MNKTSIIIMILCTAVIAAVVFFSLREEPGMGKIYLAEGLSAGNDIPEDMGIRQFSSRDSIYLIVPVTGVKKGDRLDTEWLFLEEGNTRKIQSDSIGIKQDGSGDVAVYLLKRDDLYAPGDYLVKVSYNGSQEKDLSFSVRDGH